MYRRGVPANIGFALVGFDGSPVTGATVEAYRVVDNGAQDAATGTVTEKGRGQYNFAMSAADAGGSHVSFLFLASNAFPVEKTVVTTAGNPDDGAAFGLTDLAAGTVAAAAVLDRAVLTLTAGARLTDENGTQLTALTVGQILGALAVNTLGDRAGAGTRTVVASLPGAPALTFTAARVSQTAIQMTVVVPPGS